MKLSHEDINLLIRLITDDLGCLSTALGHVTEGPAYDAMKERQEQLLSIEQELVRKRRTIY